MLVGVLMLVWVVSTVIKEAAKVREINATNTLVAVADAVIKEARTRATVDHDPKAAFTNLYDVAAKITLPTDVKLEKGDKSFSFVSIKYPKDKVTLYVDDSGAFNAQAIGFKITKP